MSSLRASLPERDGEEKKLDASRMKRHPKHCKPTTQFARGALEAEQAINCSFRTLRPCPQASELLLPDRFGNPEMPRMLLILAGPSSIA